MLLGILACTGAGEDPEPSTPEPSAKVEPDKSVEPTEPEPAPGPEPEPEAEPSEPDTFTAATRGSGNCEVTVSALLEAQEYRGPGPMTPAVAASLDRDPDYAQMYNSMSHGDHHIQCHYQVELAHEPGKHYRWEASLTNTLRHHTPKVCNGMAAEVAEDIIRTTKDCSDHDAGAYWGYVLAPM